MKTGKRELARGFLGLREKQSKERKGDGRKREVEEKLRESGELGKRKSAR